MTGATPTWLGADPGGIGSFGIALIRNDHSALSATVGCVDEAVDFFLENLKETPGGAGIDAPLWWSSGPAGDRYADQWLRKTCRLSGGEVQAVNSLRGAALVQAAMLVLRLREHFPALPVTESHPKAILKHPHAGGWNAFAEQHQLAESFTNEHERDALIAAVAAREGFGGRWKNDLSTVRNSSEQDPKRYWLAPVHYYWPE
jgi:predicted nuclease with RNAse H fold